MKVWDRMSDTDKMETFEQARNEIQHLRYEMLSGPLGDLDPRLESELASYVKLRKALAFLELASLELETF